MKLHHGHSEHGARDSPLRNIILGSRRITCLGRNKVDTCCPNYSSSPTIAGFFSHQMRQYIFYMGIFEVEAMRNGYIKSCLIFYIFFPHLFSKLFFCSALFIKRRLVISLQLFLKICL